jgi:hypothetical protein
MNRTAAGKTGIYAPDFTPLGELSSRLSILRTGVAYGMIGPGGGTVDVTYIGPDELS